MWYRTLLWIVGQVDGNRVRPAMAKTLAKAELGAPPKPNLH